MANLTTDGSRQPLEPERQQEAGVICHLHGELIAEIAREHGLDDSNDQFVKKIHRTVVDGRFVDVPVREVSKVIREILSDENFLRGIKGYTNAKEHVQAAPTAEPVARNPVNYHPLIATALEKSIEDGELIIARKPKEAFLLVCSASRDWYDAVQSGSRNEIHRIPPNEKERIDYITSEGDSPDRIQQQLKRAKLAIAACLPEKMLPYIPVTWIYNRNHLELRSAFISQLIKSAASPPKVPHEFKLENSLLKLPEREIEYLKLVHHVLQHEKISPGASNYESTIRETANGPYGLQYRNVVGRAGESAADFTERELKDTSQQSIRRAMTSLDTQAQTDSRVRTLRANLLRPLRWVFTSDRHPLELKVLIRKKQLEAKSS